MGRLLLAIGVVDDDLLVVRLPVIGRVTRTLPDGERLTLIADADEGIAKEVFWRGALGYEPETSAVFYRLAKRSGLTLDVGAYVGYYALLAAAAAPDSLVMAFEPLPAAFERLQRNVAASGSRNVRCVNAAVAERVGEMDFWTYPSKLPMASSLRPSEMEAGMYTVRVRVVRIDDVVPSGRPVGLVKIDVEGSELEALEGMRRTIASYKPDIVCEVLPERDIDEGIRELLGTLGYTYYHLRSGGPIPVQRVSGQRPLRNYLFSVRPPDELFGS